MKKIKKVLNRDRFKTDYDMNASDEYIVAKNELVSLFKANVIDNRLKIDNLFLLYYQLLFNEIYKKLLDIPGYIFEFGTRYGNFASALMSMRIFMNLTTEIEKLLRAIHLKDQKDHEEG